ncbi:hypothetical protein M409DRAFT_50300 [Zasmidium cellare ATCC 36951]|uniref:Transcription factor domain-containing protein n=1 Tax=Zasmidium cellare ATCC 36951 TaxID=1080233 RepID=A0A6A6CZP5_ZASCE|nr:uncharacterized protein M409DRAFT_50300 [Zasmidium cellare ATCC 36951]KAF2171628.1 hypothetical protein M409DRAFT_50300 [Zasmidium cellare ATCC 36951]
MENARRVEGGRSSIKRRPCRYPVVDSTFVSQDDIQPKTSDILIGDIDIPVRTATKGARLKCKRHKRAAVGEGESLTFDSARLLSLPPPLLCPQTEHVARGVSVFGYKALQLNPFGIWVKFAWSSNPGDNASLELASQYALESMLTFQSGHDQHSLRRVRQTGIMAIKSLQSDIESCTSDEQKQRLLVAVMLHWSAERFIEHGSWRHIPHLLGARKLLEGNLATQTKNQVVQSIVSMICVDEVREASDIISSILWGQVSPLENVVRPHVSLDGPPDVSKALCLVEELLIKLPRLVLGVRTLRENPDDLELMTDVVELAEQLYTTEADFWIQDVVEANSSVIDRLEERYTSPLGMAMEFDSIEAFQLATRYFLYRLLICSIVQAVMTAHKVSGVFFPDRDVSDAEQGEISAATSLAMSIDYAMRPGPSQPLTALNMLLPIQVCVASWYRLQGRHSGSNDLLYRHAVRMTEWSSEQTIRIKKIWRGRWQSWARTQSLCGIFVGDPLPEGWKLLSSVARLPPARPLAGDIKYSRAQRVLESTSSIFLRHLFSVLAKPSIRAGGDIVKKVTGMFAVANVQCDGGKLISRLLCCDMIGENRGLRALMGMISSKRPVSGTICKTWAVVANWPRIGMTDGCWALRDPLKRSLKLESILPFAMASV